MPDLSFLNRQNDILHNILNQVLYTFLSKKENNLFFYYSVQTIVAKSTKRLFEFRVIHTVLLKRCDFSLADTLHKQNRNYKCTQLTHRERQPYKNL